MEFLQEYWPALVVGLIVLAIVALVRSLHVTPELRYERRGRLITKTELKFLRALEIAAQDQWRIFAMVRIADLLKVRSDTVNRQSWQNKINCKHIDFVLCDPETLEVVATLELDDASHNRSDRIERDQFVNQAFADAGLPLLRIPTETAYDVKKLREQIDQAISR